MVKNVSIALLVLAGIFHVHVASAQAACASNVAVQWYYGSNCYPSQAAAVAAMQSDPANPQNYTLTIMAGATAMSTNTTQYKYVAPTPLSLNGGLTVYYGGRGPFFASEAQALAYIMQAVGTLGGGLCGPTTPRPNGPLIYDSDLGSPSFEAGYIQNYTGTFVVWDMYANPQCGTPITEPENFNIKQWIAYSCPAYYTQLGSQCVNNSSAYITSVVNDCPTGPSTSVGDPCDARAGGFTQTEVDYSSAGLRLTRYYHSATLEPFHGLGVGWTHNYAAQLLLNAGVPSGLIRPDGHHDPLIYESSAYYVTTTGDGIHVLPPGNSVNSSSNYWAVLDDGSVEVYNPSGVLIQLVSPGGAITALNYTNGLLSSVVGPFGHTLQFTFSNGNISTIVDPAGNSIAYAYDSFGNLSSVTYQDGSSRTYQYTSPLWPNSLTGILDESNAQFLTVTYANNGLVSSAQDAGGANAVTLTYGTASSTVTDSLGGTTTYNFSTNAGYTSRVASVSHNGLISSYIVPAPSTDPQQRATGMTDPNGNVTQYAYDADHLTSKTEAYGTPQSRTTSFQYLSPASALPTLVTEALKTTTTVYYPGTNNVHTRTITDTTVTPNVSRTWSYTYNSYGQVLTVDGSRTDVSDVTTYTYYPCITGAQCGQVDTVTNALNQTTTYNTYNAHGQPLTMTDPNGIVTTLAYDSRLRLISRSTAGETTTFSYYPTGLLKQVTLPDGSYLLNTYGAAHRLTQINDGLGNKIVYTLDGMGNHTAENTYDPTGALALTHSRVFNTLNELYKEIDAAGTPVVTTIFGYDNNGNPTTINAPLGRLMQNGYDALNRLSKITDPANGVAQLSYDANDDLTGVIDPLNLMTSYAYSGFGDLTRQTSPDTGVTSNTYDSAGNLLTSTDARGAVANYSYDALNRVQVMAYSLGPIASGGGNIDQAIGLTYDSTTVADGIGRLASASDQNVGLTWEYDALGRVIQKSQIFGSTAERHVGYSYTNGDLTTLTTPSGQVIGYSYTNHQVTGITINGTPLLSQVTYFPFGPTLGWIWGNGTATSRGYNTDGRIASLTSAGQRSFTYYADGTIHTITSDAQPVASTLAGTATLTPASTSNRLTGVGGTLSRSYSYDAAGHVVSDGVNTFTYNNAGRLAKVTTPGGQATYTYNALGQRVRKVSPAGTTYFVYDEAGHLTGEYDANVNLIEEIVWLGDIPVASIRPSQSGGMGIFYIHTDHLNAPTKLTRANDNTVVWRWDHDPYGNGAVLEDPDGNGANVVFNLRFPGQYFDTETGLAYNMARDYDPGAGRYLESDPTGLDAGVNTYAYADGDPVDEVDPTGQGAFKIIKLCAEGYKVLKEVGFKQAVQALRRGDDVLADSTKQARSVAKAASDAKKPIRDPAHQEGYMKHYHPNPRTGGHVFYSIAAALTLTHYVHCTDCVAAQLAEVGDFFNPLSTPQDLIDISDIILGND